MNAEQRHRQRLEILCKLLLEHSILEQTDKDKMMVHREVSVGPGRRNMKIQSEQTTPLSTLPDEEKTMEVSDSTQH